MNLHDILCVALYEVKQQRRRKEFYLFVFFSLVGITVCHVFWQEDRENWKIMALPSSLPLVNSYLFSVVQSLFVMLFMTDFPRREQLHGALESIFSRPVDNFDYTWGKIIGNMILFWLVNLVVILSCQFFIHLGSVTPYRFGYYLFYFFTLNLPSLVFVMGISLWLIRLLRVRFLVILLVTMLLVLSVTWLPYRWHGTFDFLGSGLPNLFSDIMGHVGLANYLLHRSAYFLLGLGFLFLSVHGMKRIPNHLLRVKVWRAAAGIFMLVAIVCGVFIEMGYLPAREARAAFRASFRDHWRETCARVVWHDILVRQDGEEIFSESKLTLYNPNEEKLEKLILFLNPGLRVETLELGGKGVSFRVENQILIIDSALEAGDSARVHLYYRGKIDERLTDLHLSDDVYEDSFRGDQFFPTGRRSAFVSNDFILLTPASVWYPVTIPPVNPVVPIYSGRDFTRFQLSVVRPSQKILCSQGEALRVGDTCRFRPSRSVAGVSLCGGDYELHERRTPDLSIRLYTFKRHFTPFRDLPPVSGKVIHACLDRRVNYLEIPYRWSDMDWYEEKTGNLFLMETPLPFITEARVGRERSGHVEPGMVFFPERGFDLGLKSTFRERWDADGAETMFARFSGNLGTYAAFRSSHPLLGVGNSAYYRRQNAYNVLSLLQEADLSIKSKEYPFIGFLFNRICLERKEFSRASRYRERNQWENEADSYLAGRSLFSIMQDNRVAQHVLYDLLLLKSRELVDRILQDVSVDRFYSALTEVYASRRGVIILDAFFQEMNSRLGVDLAWDTLLSEWIHATHSQYFKVKDMYAFYYPSGKRGKEIIPGSYSRTGWVEVRGKVMNCGDTGGVVSVDFEHHLWEEAGEQAHYICYLNPGEAKSFHLVREGVRGFVTVTLNTGLSSNRPRLFYFEERNREGNEALKPLAGTWVDMDTSEFFPPAGEVVVDNTDAGFSLKNARETWLQKWLKKEPSFRGISGEIPVCWTPSIHPSFYGDSIRSCYFKGFGDGHTTATWRVNLSEGGKYRVSARVSRWPIAGDGRVLLGVVYSYTIKHAGGETRMAVDLDRCFESSQRYGWATLGEFDFPPGQVSVTLSDYDEQGRDYIAVVADAVKWQRLGD